MVDTQKSLNNLGSVVETMMSNLHKAAKDHTKACRNDIEHRCRKHDPNTGKSVGHVVPRMNEICGPDHKALEGFDQYIIQALLDEVSSMLKKACVDKDVPMPSALREAKEKGRKAEQARLAKAAEEAAEAGAAPSTAANPKSRPRSKSPNAPGAFGGKASLKYRILEQAKAYIATVKKIVPTSSNCDDLGRAVMSYRQSLDQRRPMSLACYASDRMRKIDSDNEGKGTAYTATGEPYERIRKELVDAKIDPIAPVSDAWLPEGAGAWLIIDGNPETDPPINNYNCEPFWYEYWSDQHKYYWRQASMELNKALRHPPMSSTSPCLALYENGWASTLECQWFLRPIITRYVVISRGLIENLCSYNWLLGVTPCDRKHRFPLAGATDAYGILEEGSTILSFGFIRANSGHSGYVCGRDGQSICVHVDPARSCRKHFLPLS